LLEATSRLSSRKGIRHHSYYCLLGLLAVSGLRISEALALQEQDVDLQSGILTIRQSKFRKSRLVPLHPSTLNALRQYVEQRDLLLPARSSDSFLVSDLGRPLEVAAVRRT
jgi:integrase